jgi:hypothetical protein
MLQRVELEHKNIKKNIKKKRYNKHTHYLRGDAPAR